MRGITPDVVTDQTPAHDVMMYVPAGLSVEEAGRLRQDAPEEYEQRSMESMAAPRAGDARPAKTGRRGL